MDEAFLYARIAEDLRQEIMRGRLRPGDRLPSIRSLELRWNCTAGTVQRAYQELSRQGLVESRPGRGTFISRDLDLTAIDSPATLRRANLVHRTDGFLIETLALGYSPGDIQNAFTESLERWHRLKKGDTPPDFPPQS